MLEVITANVKAVNVPALTGQSPHLHPPFGRLIFHINLKKEFDIFHNKLIRYQ
jgi:hypothetical protein